jgi:acyl-CoA thioesterase-1
MTMAGTFRHRTLSLMAAVGIGLLFLPGMAHAQEHSCVVPISFYDTEPTLPKTTAALAGGKTIVIVVIGGASTLGDAAGSPDLAWPARFAVALTRHFPAARVTVHNRAVARQTTQEMASRLDQEVIALQPMLVIWETGTTDAVRGTDLDEFRQTMQDGIDRLRTAEAEMVFMDMQFARRTHAVINFDRYESVLREVTDANDIPLFRRLDIMHHWVESGVFDLMTTDPAQLHLVASHLYDCIGRAMADFVARGVARGADVPGASAGSTK